jgi:hypothetical protein
MLNTGILFVLPDTSTGNGFWNGAVPVPVTVSHIHVLVFCSKKIQVLFSVATIKSKFLAKGSLFWTVKFMIKA